MTQISLIHPPWTKRHLNLVLYLVGLGEEHTTTAPATPATPATLLGGCTNSAGVLESGGRMVSAGLYCQITGWGVRGEGICYSHLPCLSPSWVFSERPVDTVKKRHASSQNPPKYKPALPKRWEAAMQNCSMALHALGWLGPPT